MLRRPLLGLLAMLTAPTAWALHDAPPNALLKHLPGPWRGTLTYRDWSKPDSLVTLACRMQAAPTSPDELSLYFVFDDGPGKTVHSCDRWLFDFAKGEMTWASGIQKASRTSYRIAATSMQDDTTTLTLVANSEGRTYRQQLASSPRSLKLAKVEITAEGGEILRNEYELSRADA